MQSGLELLPNNVAELPPALAVGSSSPLLRRYAHNPSSRVRVVLVSRFFVCPPASSLPIDQITTELQAASLVNVSPSSVRMTGPTHQRICCFAVNDSTPTQPVLLKGFHASGSGGCFRVLTNARPAKAGAWVGLSGASVSECVCLCLLSVLLKSNGFS